MRPRSRTAAMAARLWLLFAFCVLVLADGRAMRLQSGDGPYFDPVGLQADRGYFSELPWEHVDMANGNVIAKFTDLVLPGNAGMTLTFVRQYNAATRQWEFGLDGIPVFADVEHDDCCDYPEFWGVGFVEKSFPTTGVMGLADEYLTRRFWRYTRATRKLDLPNGWVGTYHPNLGRLDELRDPFHNYLTFTYGGPIGMSLESVTQHLATGETRTVAYTLGGSGGQPTAMQYDGKTWTYTWEGLTLTSVHPPAGPAWGFSYTTQQPGPCFQVFPETVSVTTPYGGVVKYEFAVRHIEGTVNPPECHAVVAARKLSGPGLEPPTDPATWTFDIPLTWTNPGWTKVSSVATPLGRQVSYTHTTHHSGGAGIGMVQSSQFLTRKEIVGAAIVERTPAFLDYVGQLSEPVVLQQNVTVDGVLHETDFTYDGPGPFADFHRPRQTTESATGNPSTRVTTRTYHYGFTPYIIDRTQSVTVAVGGEAYTTSHEYQLDNGFQTKQVVNGIETTYTPTLAGGNVGQESGAITTSFTYEGGVVEDTIRPMSTTSRAINPDGTVRSETRGIESTSYIYDNIGRPETMTPAAGDSAGTVYEDAFRKVTVCRGSQCTVTLHDGIGRPVSVTNPAGVTTTTRYDKDGRKEFESYPGGGPTEGDSYTYDALNRVRFVCHTGGPCREMAYSANAVTITDEENRVTVQRFQAFGDPFDRRLVELEDANHVVWTYSYTTLGALRSVASSAGPATRTWTYEADTHLLRSESHPESGTTTYDYDGAGRLEWKHDANGVSLRHWYDGNSRLRKIEREGTADWVEFEYDAADNRTRVTNALVNSQFKYDGANRLEKRTDTIGPRTFVTEYKYDGKDHLTEILYPSHRKVTYSPNASTGRIEGVEGPGGVTYANGIQYHPSGAITGLTFGNGTTESIQFNHPRQWPTNVVSGPAANRLDLTYQYDEVGNVEVITDGRGGSFSSNFGYDELDRLTGITGFGARGYEYDALGNRIKKSIGGVPVTYNIDGPTQRLNDIVSSLGAPETATFTYDEVGNVETDGTGTYGWTPFNTMASATVGAVTTNYGYDGEGQRKKKDGADGVRYYIHGPGGQLLAEYRETLTGPELVREYIYLGSKLIASSTRVDPPVPTGRVTGVTVSPLEAQKYGTSLTITVTGWATPCSKVQVNFGDGTVTPYTIASPYQLPLVVTHTYAAAGLYTVVATGQTGASGPCLGTISTPVEVTSGNVVTNGTFAQVDGAGNPVNWSIFYVGDPPHWSLPQPPGPNGILFHRHGASVQAVVLQYTGLALGPGAPLELTFTMGNTDTIAKRLLVLVHDSAFGDLAACSFWLDPSQASNTAYTMRLHTTMAWTNASVAFYAADANTPSSHGDYHLNNVTLTHRPAGNSAKTECVDPMLPASNGEWHWANMLYDEDFVYGPPWWTFTGHEARWNAGAVVGEAYRKTGGAPPTIQQPLRTEQAGVVGPAQRVQVTFELRNASTTRQRVNITIQNDDPSDLRQVVCTFWLAPGPTKRLYAMTTHTATGWPNGRLIVAPQTVGAEATHGWMQLDAVRFKKTNRAMLGTECYEPGSFVLDADGFLIPDTPQAPAPVPVPEADALTVDDSFRYGGYASYAGSPERALAGPQSSEAWFDGITFHLDRADISAPASASEPARTDPLTVTLGGTSSGTVTSSPAGINCSGATVSCTGWFAEGTPVTLTATPDTGLVFVGWAGVCTGTGTCQITINGPQSVVAHFASPLQYYHLDVLGSVRMVTNAAGAVVKRHDYFAFGEDIEGPTGDPRRFTGKERDPETELHYFGARYYRNLWGRFTSVDPVMNLDDAVVDPQRWNRYSYVTNRPTQFVDPDGRNLLKWAYKIGKVVVKGGSLAAEFEGVLSDVDTLTSGESSIWAKAGALASLATEVVSPVSARDAKGIVQAVVKRGDDAARTLGRARETAVAGLTGGRVVDDLAVRVPGGVARIDVVGAAGEFIAVGGPGEANNLSRLGSQLKYLKDAAALNKTVAKAYFAKGTPDSVIALAKKWLGDDNVMIFDHR